MVSVFISRIIIVIFCQLYPAYASYKAVKTKNVKEYVKWMMYWIVFANFSAIETFADVFISWVPFYYELKILFLIWLLSPVTKGSSIIYRKLIHKQLAKHEKKIDEYIEQASEKGYKAVLNLGSQGLNYATNVVVQTALRGQVSFVDQLKKSYSLNDLSGKEIKDSAYMQDETDNQILEESYRSEISKSSHDISNISDNANCDVVDEEDDDYRPSREHDDTDDESEEGDEKSAEESANEDVDNNSTDEEFVTESIEIVHHRPDCLPVENTNSEENVIRIRKSVKKTSESKFNTIPRSTRTTRSKTTKCTF